MRIVFMGSAHLSCVSLEKLLSAGDIDVALAVTQPDRPKGRNRHVLPCPSKEYAEKRGIPVVAPENVNSPEAVERLAAEKADCFVVVAYGAILKPAVLDVPPMGCINVHTSLLPKYRGAAPIQWAIAGGETVTGVTTMHLNEGMDEGDIVYQDAVPITPDDTAGSLHDKLAVRGGDLLLKTLRDLKDGVAPRIPQDSQQATYAPKLTKQDGRIDWKEDCDVIYNKIRGFNPWPMAWCISGSAIAKREDCVIRIISGRCVAGGREPGRILRAGDEGIDVGTGDGILRIDELQIEGGRRMDAQTFLRGHFVEEGKNFG